MSSQDVERTIATVRVQRRRSRAHLEPVRRLRHLHDHQRAGQRAPPAASRRQVHDRSTTPARGSRRSSRTPTTSKTGTNTYQLRHYDGYQTDLPVADNVVDFRVEFFGDPLPPQMVRPVERSAGSVDHLRSEAAGHGTRQRQGPLGRRRELHLPGRRRVGAAGRASGDPDAGTARRPPVADAAGDAHRRSLVPVRPPTPTARTCRTSSTPTCCACARCG